MPKISNDLIEAYKGVHGDDLTMYYLKQEGKSLDDWVVERIQNDPPKQRLDTYLQWNGILGWTNRIWEISQGEM